MKNLSTKNLIITLGLFAFVVLGVNLTTTLAQGGELSNLESKMNQFMDLLLANEAIEEPAMDDFAQGQQAMAFEGGEETPPSRCMDGFSTWPTSEVYQEGDWESYFIKTDSGTVGAGHNYFHTFTDVNGDGLPDYLYLMDYSSPGPDIKQNCIMLNNGSGWEPEYRCRIFRPDNLTPWTYYGDCAAPVV